jgi:hypothetical protein
MNENGKAKKMKNTITKRKWFWAWQDEKEEAWLEEMSAEGFHLVSPGFFGRYTFEKGQPKDYVYRLDFVTPSDKAQKEVYLQLFADAGWTHLGELGGWQYFRITADDHKNHEIFTDAESKIKKYQRLLRFLVIFTPIYLSPIYLQNFADETGIWWIDALMILFTLMILLFGFAVIKIISRISELKKTIQQ